MKNTYAKQLQAAAKRGVDNGRCLEDMLILLALYNVLPDYMDEGVLPGCIQAVETEMNRLVVEEYDGNPQDYADSIVGHVMEIRRELGMGVLC